MKMTTEVKREIENAVYDMVKYAMFGDEIPYIEIKSFEVFGSRLEGTHREDSDLDIKVEYVNEDMKECEVFNMLNGLELEYDGLVVDFFPVQVEENNNKEVKEVTKMKREKDIEIFSIEETGYEDGSYWVEYMIGTSDTTSIEIVNGDEEDTEEDIKKKFFEKGAEKLCNKINLEECSEKMQEVIHDCLMSENGTWYIDESDDMEKEELEQLIAEIEELGLCNCMVVDDEEGIEITIYGETITKFIY